jgi:hypothetical protein
MKTWITTSLTLIGILSLNTLVKAQDYNDIGRTENQEIEILHFNGYKIQNIHSDNLNKVIIAKKQDQKNGYVNIITIDKKSEKVVGVVWNFDPRNLIFIKSLLSDMSPTDSTYSQMENKKGIAQLTFDPEHKNSGTIVWKKKS